MKGKVILITGAARGIGEATARLAADRGAHVALVGLEPDLLAKVTADLPGRHFCYPCDVTDSDSLVHATEATAETFGRIDVVIANAGVANLGTVAVSPVEALTRTIEVNLLGVVRTVHATLRHVGDTKGYYLLVSSAAAFTALPGMAAYCASKAGVEAFGNALRLEVAHRGIAVGSAHPSWVDTDLVRDVKQDLPSFREALRRLPPPFGSTTSVDACARAFVNAIERRRRRVYVPRSVGAASAMRTLISGPAVGAVLRRQARESVPEMERQVRALGRNFGEHSTGRGES